MKIAFWILLLVLVGLVGYLTYSFIRQRRTQVDFVDYEVSRDSVESYQRRVVELEARAESLRVRLEDAHLVERPSVRARLSALNREIAALKHAVEQWQTSRSGGTGSSNVYRQCVLLYGRASGVCDALSLDTLGPGREGK